MNSARRPALAIAAFALLWMASVPSRGADEERGKALYELGCGLCHGESVHGRKARVATSFEEIRQWVSRWNEHLQLRWTEDDVDSVALYLNRSYYRYPCPPQVCKQVSSIGDPPRR